MFTHCIRVHTGAWLVRCLDCQKELGTFNYGGLKRAMDFGLKRGGVKCPECRKNCCPRCSWRGEAGELCPICVHEVKRDIDPYLVASV